MSKKTVIASRIITGVEYWGTIGTGVAVVLVAAHAAITDPDRIIFAAVPMIAWTFIVLIGTIVARNIVIHFEVKEMGKKDDEERQVRVRASLRDRGEHEEYEDEEGNQIIRYYRKG